MPANPLNRTPTVFLQQLAKYHARPVYFTRSARFQNLFSLQAGSILSSKGFRPRLVNQGRNPVASTKTSNQKSSLQPRRFLQPTFSRSKERRWPAASTRPECTKPVYPNRALQNGEPHDPEIPLKQRGFYDKYRFNRCLFNGANTPRLAKIPSFCLGKGNLSVYSNAFRLEHSTTTVHQNNETRSCTSTKPRCTVNHLPRRHSCTSINNTTVAVPQISSSLPAGIPRVPYQLQKIKSMPDQTAPFLRNVRQFSNHAIHFTTSKIGSNFKGVSTLTKHTKPNYSTSVSRLGAPGIHSSCGADSSSTLSPPSSLTNKRPPDTLRLRFSRTSNTSSQDRLAVVDSSPTKPTGQPNHPTHSRRDYLIGCLQTRLGSILGHNEDRWMLDRDGVQRPHQHFRTSGSIFCSEILPVVSNQQSGLPTTGQHDRRILHQQHGGYAQSTTSPLNTGTVGLVRTEKDLPSSEAHSRCNEYRSGFRVPNTTRSQRLEIASAGDRSANQTVHSRSICVPPHTSTEPLCQLETGPKCPTNRCVHDGLDEPKSVCVPSVQPNCERIAQSSKGEGDSSASSASLDHSTLVASTDRVTNGLPNLSGEQSQSTTRSHRSAGGSSTFPSVETSRMENIRHRFETMGLSEQAVELLSKSVKTSTTKTYNVSWSQWSRWCSKRQSDPVLCPVTDIVAFLAEQFSMGKAYRSINVLRSAISSAHQNVDNQPVGQHPLVVRLMRGISISRPPRPRYQHTWDVSVVTSYLASLGDNSKLSLKQLSQKLCMLMALTCPERSSIMATLDIAYMRHYPEGIQFSHTTFRKRSHCGKLGDSVYPKFSDKSLCPVQCLLVYLERTKVLRNNDTRLFLSFKKPHKPVSSSTLSRWVKEVIKLSGIKDDIFSGHSVRSASTSAAKAAGLPVDTILSMADWTNQSTFNTFYYKPSLQVSYGTAVLTH